MKQGFKACVCAVVLCAELFAAGALSAYAAQEQPLPDSGMTLDTAELTLDITEGDPAPVAYLNVQAPNDYFFLIWTSSDPAVASKLTEKIYFYQQKYGLVNMKMRIL